VLSTVPVMFSYWAKPEDTLDLARFLNDDIARTVASNPKRFVGTSVRSPVVWAANDRSMVAALFVRACVHAHRSLSLSL
jgi:hypothetical protein